MPLVLVGARHIALGLMRRSSCQERSTASARNAALGLGEDGRLKDVLPTTTVWCGTRGTAHSNWLEPETDRRITNG